ncbi:MAG: hypothetical protein ACFFD4_40225 [Candidatus Odinarchaeota archaeon]
MLPIVFLLGAGREFHTGDGGGQTRVGTTRRCQRGGDRKQSGQGVRKWTRARSRLPKSWDHKGPPSHNR